jgi:hypothetical protein
VCVPLLSFMVLMFLSFAALTVTALSLCGALSLHGMCGCVCVESCDCPVSVWCTILARCSVIHNTYTCVCMCMCVCVSEHAFEQFCFFPHV